MDQVVTAAEANRDFSRLLREVREGRSFTITSHGRPVARIGPVDLRLDEREAAKEALLERLRSQPTLNAGRWTRDELYD
jgi:prevent-host-death family protein